MRHLNGSIISAAMGLALLVGACDVREPFPDTRGPLSATVYVVNDNANEVDFYVVRPGTRHRIAQIYGQGSAVIELGELLLSAGDVTLLAVTRSGETYQTSPITAAGHTRIAVALHPVLSESDYWVDYDDALDSAMLNQETL